MENKKKLTVWESACIITGYGVGGGVLSMPYMAERNGFLVAMLVLLAALAASYVLHLMIAVRLYPVCLSICSAVS